ncbi:hypothetical protein EV132_11310 [Rhizobium sullae]|uniref:Uncharacterized protein n=1 Tax=Rhizobium sullae TaxID=50338 RepID=A0A4R3PYR8_RHISU|nr:hypothetical protein EV132_11310 [Rhizobium sullae]
MAGIVAEVDGSDLLSIFDKRLECLRARQLSPPPKPGKVEPDIISTRLLLV